MLLTAPGDNVPTWYKPRLKCSLDIFLGEKEEKPGSIIDKLKNLKVRPHRGVFVIPKFCLGLLFCLRIPFCQLRGGWLGYCLEPETRRRTCEAGILERYLGRRATLCTAEMSASLSVRCGFLHSEGFVSLSLCLTGFWAVWCIIKRGRGGIKPGKVQRLLLVLLLFCSCNWTASALRWCCIMQLFPHGESILKGYFPSKNSAVTCFTTRPMKLWLPPSPCRYIQPWIWTVPVQWCCRP